MFDLIIIGGGIVGLATARAALRRFPRLRVLVLEKEARLAAHQSGRNSGVIHSGVYYRPGSAKARLCVEGAAAMLAFCREHDIAHEICGKVIVATQESELAALEELHRRGQANGVTGLAMLDRTQLREVEPHANGRRALRVPGAAITDYAAVAEKLAALVRQAGGEIRTGARVVGIERRGKETTVETTAGAFGARVVVNCAGLHSDRLSRLAGAGTGLQIVPFRGEYYELAPARRALVRGLIYPVPDPAFPFLGVHLTRTVQGGVEAGPNAVLALKREGYRRTDFNLRDAAETLLFPGFWRLGRKYWRRGLEEFYRSLSKRAFLRALQHLVPDLREEDLVAGGAGVRAQALDRDGSLLDDFRFARSEGMLHVCNVPSPAATASIPIGKKIVKMVAESGDLGT